ncbi:hypothetical protein MIND_00392300 [Mycena indigotica]|uniref:F-box domain-containing protein n=1 Tax=Mycena indigotica TaxID=2126181 RepID=A0A8H6W9Y6_9AGAR|nr:uncharacterized protein MIND_00392300 [Mycena indigotica]KAF7310187.1 hypothetical protein MIND_00392300 [Mycena indigotica]
MCSLPSATFALPQELVDIIVPIVADHSSLKACCLVSRSFCAPAQRRLFASLELLPSSMAWQEDYLALASLDALQTQSPQISGYVRRLTIDLRGPWLADDAFSRVLRRFDRLTTLVLDSELHSIRRLRQPLEWMLLPLPAQAALRHIMAQPTLTSLTLRGIQFAVFSELRDAFEGRTQLRQLLVDNVSLSKLQDDSDPGSNTAGTLLLDSLSIFTEAASFIRHLPTLLHIPALRGMELLLPSKECEDAAGFACDARALRTLTIDLQHQDTLPWTTSGCSTPSRSASTCPLPPKMRARPAGTQDGWTRGRPQQRP